MPSVVIMGNNHGIMFLEGAVQNTEVNTDDLYDVVVNPRRRFILRCLIEQPKPMAMADLAMELTKWKEDLSKDQISNDQVRSQYIELYHVHIPKMEAVGLLSYDAANGTIDLVDEVEESVSSLV